MPTKRYPRRGSLAFRPRVRAKRIYPEVNAWPAASEAKVLGFAGYKAGMSHLIVIDRRKGSQTEGQDMVQPVTVLDCPPMLVLGVRAYEKTSSGLKAAGEALSKTLSKDLKRTMPAPKKYDADEKIRKLAENNNIADVRLLVHTVPRKSGLGKKRPEVFEVAIGGDVASKLAYAQQVLGKEIAAKDVFREGDYVDVVAVTKGYGTTGVVKRFGVKILSHKEGKGRRDIGSMGQKRPGKVRWTVPQAGQYGFHSRTELNKRILKIGDAGRDVTPKGGFLHYGVVTGNYVMLEGSVPGPAKRLIRLRHAIRAQSAGQVPEIKYVSTESKQGV